MKVKVTVENHRPVPLRSVERLIYQLISENRMEAVIYLDMVYWNDCSISRVVGWHMWRRGGGWTPIDGKESFDGEEIAYAKSTGRLLQPGEILRMEVTND